MKERLETLDLAKKFSPNATNQKRLYKMGRLAASIVHDLRNPLAAICGCAEMLLEANLTPAQTARIASNIYRSASRMRGLLVDLASTTRGRPEAIERCNLRAILAASCEAAGAAERGDVELLVKVPERIEIPVSRSRMERVFQNLIVNAMEAMPGGGTIRITAVERGDHLMIQVEDTGPGISADIRDRLFEPFVTTGKKEGLGLGLTLSRQTVREHGGELWVKPARGACFVISLPLSNQRYASGARMRWLLDPRSLDEYLEIASPGVETKTYCASMTQRKLIVAERS